MLVITKGRLDSLFESPQHYFANLLMIFGALCWVIYTIGGSFYPKWTPIKYTSITTLLWLISIFLVNGILLGAGVIALPSLETIGSITPQLLYMALIAGFVGVLSWNSGNKIITPLNGVLFMDVVPVTAFIISSFVTINLIIENF